jgi:ATP-binding cassette subfamily B protein
MLKEIFWPESIGLLENYSQTHMRNFRLLAFVSLLSMILVSVVPYIAGTFVSRLVNMEEEEGIVDVEFIINTATLVVLIITFWYITIAIVQRETSKMGLLVTRKMREDLNDKLMRMSISQIDEIRSGVMPVKVSVDMPAISNLISRDFVAFFTGSIMIIMIVVAMIVVSPALALVYIVTIPLTLLASRTLTTLSEKDFVERKQAVDAMGAGMSDLIANHRTIKTNNLEDLLISRFEVYNRRFREASVSSEARSGLIAPISTVAVNLGYVLTVVIGAAMTYQGSLDIGMFLAFMVYVRLVNKPLTESAVSYDTIKSETVSLKRVLNILNSPEEEEGDVEEGFEAVGKVEFEDVHFSYEGSDEVLHGVSFSVEPGKVAVITGPTGSGKTTVLNLLLRFYLPDSGSIRIDGRDVRSISRKDLGKAVAAVFQDPWVFDGTIKENIVYNRDWVTQEDLDKAMEITGFAGYVKSLPEGIDTKIGNDIRVLPLAQRRMLAMTRAILGNPKILILDEAFSGLDPLTETAVFDGLKRMMSGRTVMIVSHERNLVENADQVVRMESGRVVS